MTSVLIHLSDQEKAIVFKKRLQKNARRIAELKLEALDFYHNTFFIRRKY